MKKKSSQWNLKSREKITINKTSVNITAIADIADKDSPTLKTFKKPFLPPHGSGPTNNMNNVPFDKTFP